MVDVAQVGALEKRRQRLLISLCLIAVAVLVLSQLRFVPRLDDSLSGRPEYVRILTESFARQLATQTQMQSPVLIEHDEQGNCRTVVAPSIPDEEVQGTLYLLTYSEQQHLTCLTTYIVPTDAVRFPGLRVFTRSEGRNYGATLLGTVRAVAESRIVHLYSPEYLKRLHWRYQPHFPLSPREATSLRSETYYSGATQTDGSLGIDFDFGELRNEVRKQHEKVNVRLSLLLVGSVALCLLLLQRVWVVYRTTSQCCGLYELKLTPRAFVRGKIARRMISARQEYFERQQQTQERLREQDRLRGLRSAWLDGLRSALPNLVDEQLRRRVQDLVATESQDLEHLRSVWAEVQEQIGQKTPAEKLDILLESAKVYCTEEEFVACRTEAIATLSKSGFREARAYAVTMHDRFRVRAREMAELEERSNRATS